VHWLHRAWGVDEDAFFTLVNRLRASLPEEVKKAVQVSKEADRIIQEAHQQASRLIQDAKEQAALLVSQDEIIKQAQRQGQEIVARAQEESARIRGEIDAYCRQALDNLERSVQQIMSAIEKGRTALQAPAAAESEE